MNAIEMYQNPAKFPTLIVSQHEIINAVRSLVSANQFIPALKLIRSAYRTDDGSYATLGEAKEIFLGITGIDLSKNTFKEIENARTNG